MPVEVTHIKRSTINRSGVEGLGGIWRDKPWYVSEHNLIWEIQRPDNERQWDFFVRIANRSVPLTVAAVNGRKHLTVADMPITRVGLPEWREPIPV